MALSGALAIPSAYAATCTSNSNGNWDTITWGGCTSGPQAGDSVSISHGISLNGVSTPALVDVKLSSSGLLSDAGGSGSLTTQTTNTAVYGSTLDFTQNNSTFTATGSGITLGTYWAGGSKWLSSTAKFGTGAVTLAGGITVYPDQMGSNTHGKFTMNSGGTLEFTTGSNITAYARNTFIAVITLKGTPSLPLTLKTAGTTTFTAPTLANTTAGGGTYDLDYVHFATGTWVVDPSVTITPPPNCTYATGATPPAAWTGCVNTTPPSGPTPISVPAGLIMIEPAQILTEEINLK